MRYTATLSLPVCDRSVPAQKTLVLPSVTKILRMVSKAEALVNGSIMKCLLMGVAL